MAWFLNPSSQISPVKPRLTTKLATHANAAVYAAKTTANTVSSFIFGDNSKKPLTTLPQNSPTPVKVVEPSSVQSTAKRRDVKQLGAGRMPEYKVHVISQVKDSDGKPIRVSAYLPETISVDYSSDYRTPFNQSVLGDNLFGNVLRAFGNSGIVQEMTYMVWDTSRGLTFDLPLVFVADDEFEEDSAENSDIMTPILKLNRLCAPSKVKDSKFLKPPGSSLKFTGASFSDSFAQTFNEATTDKGVDNDESTDYSKYFVPGFGVASLISDYGSAATDALATSISGQVALENVTSVYLGNFIYLDSVECEAVSQQYDVVLGPDGKPMRATVNFRFTTSMVPTIEDLYRYFHKSINNVPSNAVGG
jgi:hypothetical protein